MNYDDFRLILAQNQEETETETGYHGLGYEKMSNNHRKDRKKWLQEKLWYLFERFSYASARGTREITGKEKKWVETLHKAQVKMKHVSRAISASKKK